MRSLILKLVASSLVLAGMPATVFADAASEVIAITKAQWAAQIENDVSASMNNVADDYTEFNPDVPIRLDGKALNMRIAEATASGSGRVILAEMTNPHVQVYSNVAVLSYNFVGMTKNGDGEVDTFLAKSTRVYVKKGRDWRLVHANFAPVTVPDDG
jgi:ketosteroid isomerase-like protein